MEGLSSVDSKNEVDTACSYFYFLWARNAELNGRDDEAQEAYEKAIVCDGSDEYLVRRLAALLLKMGKRAQAINRIEKLIAARPADVNIKIFLADLYASTNEVQKAVNIYKSVLHQAPGNNTVMLKLGKLYMHNFEYTKARGVLERLLKKDPESFAGLYYLARLYRELGYLEKAAAAYERALDINWSLPLAMEAAEFYERQKENKQAIVIYKKILVEDDNDEVVIGRLVRLYLQKKEADKALTLLRSLRDRTTDNLKIDFTIGRIFLDQKEYDKAIALFKDMQINNPGVGEIRSLLALSYYESGAKEKAKELLLAVSPETDGYDDAILLLVKIYADEKDYAEAVNLLQGAISQTKGDEQLNFYFGMAAVYEENKQLDKAKETLQTAIKQSASARGHLKYGMFLDRTAEPDKALSQMEKVLELEPDNIMALNYVGYTWADRGIKLELALAYVKKAIAGQPDDGFIRDSLGWVYFKLGEMKKAVAELQKALRDEPDDPTIHEHLGDVYNAMRAQRQALGNYQQSLSLLEKKVDQERLQGKIRELQGQMNFDSGSQNGE
jgi:tetratricopeptide (TPR) repeat protein